MTNPPPPLRGVIHRLGEAAGILNPEPIPAALKPGLKPLGIEAGNFALYLPSLLKPRPAALRAALLALWHNEPTPELPAAGLVSAPNPENWHAGKAIALGWVPAGPVMLRLDIAEKISRELFYAVRKHPVPVPAALGSRMSLKPDHLAAALNALGFRIIPAPTLAANAFGPPAPPMLARRKTIATKPPAAPPPPLPDADNPFAALAALKRA